MSVEVLTTPIDNQQARIEMRRRGLDCVTPWFTRVLHKARIVRGVNVGMLEKSWDVLRTLQFLQLHVSKTAPIIDFGAYASEVLCSLDRAGYSNLTGIDLNQGLLEMPCNDRIKYVVGDFTNTGFPSETFEAITAISVLEHGFCGPRVLREASRILSVGGYLIGSIDYWPEKIDTSGVSAFGLEWTIFSKQEFMNLIEEARGHGLVPVGYLNFEAPEKTVTWLEREYTFAWFALRKVLESRVDE